MENSNLFWKQAAEWLMNLGLPFISEFEAMLIFLAAFLILLLILWLIFRKARLWYWKTDLQIDTLKNIDNRLHSVEYKLSQTTLAAAEEKEKNRQEPCRSDQGKTDESPQENAAQEMKGIFAVGKSGKIYTEAELEVQIKE